MKILCWWGGLNQETKYDIIEISRGYLGAFILTYCMWTGRIGVV